jgi:diguanylate cyclase (GGDEF)-like protein
MDREETGLSDAGPGERGRALMRAVFGAGCFGLLAYAVFLALGSPARFDWFANIWLYNGVLFAGAAVCFLRAASAREVRGAWLAFGAGLTSWSVADTYWTVAFENAKHVPYPSLADLGYLLAIPCFFVGIALIIRHRVGHFTLTRWLDGAIAALAAAACASAVLAPALAGLTHGAPATVTTNLAYPLGDLLLVGMLAGTLTISGVRGAGVLLRIGAGLIIWTGADIISLWTTATSTAYSPWLDSLWLIGALLMASGALSPARSLASGPRRYQVSLLFPAISTAAAVVVLVFDHFSRVHVVSVWLAAATIIAIAIRLLLSHKENARLIAAFHKESVTDPLTELPNRRALLRDFDRLFAEGLISPDQEYVCALFDLDGFKAYNDSFGHPAGDALLRRLGASLAEASGPLGATAYRLGGDEFCVIAPLEAFGRGPMVESARAALSERGPGFSIGASGGAVVLPREAGTSSEALRLSDQRMYEEKAIRHAGRSHDDSRAADPAHPVHELLMEVMRGHEPELVSHVDGVARLALDVGRELGVAGEDLDVLMRAAEMHDIGKIAIPEEILHKPGPLNDSEWELMRRHPLVGARIIGSAPPLVPIANLVRSAHERWDGKGYCEGLAGSEIPLGSRIIFVCDAFEAMTEDRPYRKALSVEAALDEIRRNSGTQFDPAVADALMRVTARRPAIGGLVFNGVTG